VVWRGGDGDRDGDGEGLPYSSSRFLALLNGKVAVIEAKPISSF